MSPSDRIEVVVKPNNRYGEAKAGDVINVTRRELDMHPHCLEVARPLVEGPRTAVVVLPADRAAAMGLPLGRRKEGPVAFEVTRLKPDGKPQLPTRDELAARNSVTVSIADAPEVKLLLASAKAECEAVEANVTKAQQQIEDLQQALRVSQDETKSAREEATRLAQELAQVRTPADGEAQTQAKGRRG